PARLRRRRRVLPRRAGAGHPPRLPPAGAVGRAEGPGEGDGPPLPRGPGGGGGPPRLRLAPGLGALRRGLRPVPADVDELMLHELTHCVMYQRSASAADWSRKRIPLWFREGMASVTASQSYRWP